MKKVAPLLLFFFLTTTHGSGKEPVPKPGTESFLMVLEDFFSIAGVGTVATGTIERGKLAVGDEVELVGFQPTRSANVTSIKKPSLREAQTGASKGDEVSLVLKGITASDLTRGQVIAKPGTIEGHSKFTGVIDLAPAPAGGKKTPIATGYRTMVIVRSAIFSGIVTLAPGSEPVEPGTQGVEVEIELSMPAPLEIGQEIILREGSRVIATGKVRSLERPD